MLVLRDVSWVGTDEEYDAFRRRAWGNTKTAPVSQFKFTYYDAHNQKDVVSGVLKSNAVFRTTNGFLKIQGKTEDGRRVVVIAKSYSGDGTAKTLEIEPFRLLDILKNASGRKGGACRY